MSKVNCFMYALLRQCARVHECVCECARVHECVCECARVSTLCCHTPNKFFELLVMLRRVLKC